MQWESPSECRGLEILRWKQRADTPAQEYISKLQRFNSKQVLQGELHNPRIQGIADLAEDVAADDRIHTTQRTTATCAGRT